VGATGITGAAGANGPTGNVFATDTSALTTGATISDTDTHIYYFVNNTGGTQNSDGSLVSSGKPQTISLPHATTAGRVVVLIAICRTVSSSNTCNVATDGNSQPIDGSQIIANVQSGDTIILENSADLSGTATPSTTQAQAEQFTLSLFTDGNHHWYLFDSGS